MSAVGASLATESVGQTEQVNRESHRPSHHGPRQRSSVFHVQTSCEINACISQLFARVSEMNCHGTA